MSIIKVCTFNFDSLLPNLEVKGEGERKALSCIGAWPCVYGVRLARSSQSSLNLKYSPRVTACRFDGLKVSWINRVKGLMDVSWHSTWTQWTSSWIIVHYCSHKSLKCIPSTSWKAAFFLIFASCPETWGPVFFFQKRWFSTLELKVAPPLFWVY